MLDVDGTTGQGGDKLDLSLVEEIVIAPCETGMGLLLDLKVDITSQDARALVSLASELDLGTALHTPVDVDVEDLPVHDGLLAVALLASVLVLDHLALAVAVRAHGLETLDHGTHLAHHGLCAMAVTTSALPHGSLLSTAALALGADDRPLQGQLGDLAAVDVLQRDLVGVVDRPGLGGSALRPAAAEHASEAATAEELGEKVLGGHATSTTGLEAGLAILVVDLAFLRVGKDLVGVRDLLEFLLGCRVVRVLV